LKNLLEIIQYVGTYSDIKALMKEIFIALKNYNISRGGCQLLFGAGLFSCFSEKFYKNGGDAQV